MFTGIIESVGKITKIQKYENYLTISISHSLEADNIKIGDSIACDGACLTVVDVKEKEFSFEISQETIARTILKGYKVGSRVNLERAVRVGDRLDGHLVTGHIDETGTVVEIEPIGKSIAMTLEFDPEQDSLIVDKGSVAVNGVSLTINESESGRCRVNLIPHSIEQTNLAQLQLNDRVNIEFDLIGKYATKSNRIKSKHELTFAKLKESGW